MWSLFCMCTAVKLSGGPSPLRPWCISPLVSDFPPIFEKFLRLRRKFSRVYFFLEKLLIFFRQFYWRLFSVIIDHKFEISPSIFVLSAQFPLVSTKSFIPPYFAKFPSWPDFIQFPCFVHAFCDFCFPLLLPWCIYASHNAHRPTGRPCRLLLIDQLFAELNRNIFEHKFEYC